jgi:hypothetical protein
MATTINEATKIAFLDGTEIEVSTLKISLLRDFMKSFEQIAAVAEDNEKSMNLLLDCVQIALKQFKPELAEDRKALEDILDLPTVYKIVEEASGIPMGYGVMGGNA